MNQTLFKSTLSNQSLSAIDYQPRTIQFEFFPNSYPVGSITITNKLNSRVIFKLKSTQPKSYIVKPNIGLLEARTQQVVQFTLHHLALQNGPENFSDKFQLIALPLENEILAPSPSIDDLEKFMKDANPNRKQEVKLVVELRQNGKVLNAGAVSAKTGSGSMTSSAMEKSVSRSQVGRSSIPTVLTFKTDEGYQSDYMDYAFLNKVMQAKINEKEEEIKRLEEEKKKLEEEKVRIQQNKGHAKEKLKDKIIKIAGPIIAGIAIQKIRSLMNLF